MSTGTAVSCLVSHAEQWRINKKPMAQLNAIDMDPVVWSRKMSKLWAARLESGTQKCPAAYDESKTKLHGLGPRANYTDRATAACRRSDCQLLRIEGATWSA
jgi:hypothetical protein